jgi:hypothetical protein
MLVLDDSAMTSRRAVNVSFATRRVAFFLNLSGSHWGPDQPSDMTTAITPNTHAIPIATIQSGFANRIQSGRCVIIRGCASVCPRQQRNCRGRVGARTRWQARGRMMDCERRRHRRVRFNVRMCHVASPFGDAMPRSAGSVTGEGYALLCGARRAFEL